MNIYDRIIQENIYPLISGLLPRFFGKNFTVKEFLPRKLQITLEKETDFIAIVEEIPTAQRYVVHVEFQATNDMDMLARMQLYKAIIYHKTNLNVLQLVVYIGDDKPTMKTKHDDGICYFEYSLIWTKDISYHDFLSSEKPEEVLFAILANFQESDGERVVSQIIERLRELVSEKKSLQRYLVQLEVFSNLRDLQIITAKKVEGMIEYDLKRDVRFQQGLREGELKGLREGELKGLREGELKGKIEVAKALLMLGKATHEEIAQVTGLPLDKIKKLDKE